MAKQKTSFYCQNCGANSAKWVGKCPACDEWNTYIEEVVVKDSANAPTMWSSQTQTRKKSKPAPIHEIAHEELVRYSTHDDELDRVLGGGVVHGSLVLIGGEPGIGKSTLMLQVAIKLQDLRILYVSGEESPTQIKMRADRIGIQSEQCYLLSETSLSNVFTEISQLDPHLIVIDSIQTLFSANIDSAPGSVSQVKECTGQLMRFAKESNTAVFLIGHINKDGNIAGPKVLEHMVDTVLQFEGDRHHMYRILRTTKNRFGSTSELGIYQMEQSGLRQVQNPSEILLSGDQAERSGVAIAASIEGNRPLMIEVQALVSTAAYGTPQRSTTGFDVKRLHMLLAVLEKRMGLRLGTQDVFLNITGGVRVDDPSIDLAVCAAVYSSYHDISISRQACFAGEVGLGGEVRTVNRIENRFKEAEKLGFAEIFTAVKSSVSGSEIQQIGANSLQEVLREVFG